MGTLRGVMRYAALILILLTGAISANESNGGKSFICIADKATGFYFDEQNKSWDQTKFNVADSKHLVRPISESDSKRSIYFFRGGYVNSAIELGLVNDDLPYDSGRNDAENVYAKGREDQGGDTPYIEIGKCSKL